MKFFTEKLRASSKAIKIISPLFMILGILITGCFIPAAAIRVINAGTYFGFAIGVVFFLTGIFMPICRKSEKKAVRMLFDIFVAVLTLLIIYAIILSVLMITKINDHPGKDSNRAVIVLGCQVKKSGPSLMLRNRLDAAYGYLTENPDVICIVSGGKGDDEHISEAQAMYDYLVEKGIDGSRIIKEDKSTSTMENLLFSADILKDNGMPLEAVLVTDSFHQMRAGLMAKNIALDVKSISSSTPLYLLPVYWVREWLALSYLFVFGVGND